MAQTVREQFARFQSLAANIQANLAEMPDLGTNFATFDALVGRIRDSLAEQDAITARLSDLISARQNDMKEALEIRHRLAGQLQGRFGTGSEKLREFGIKPRRRRSRRKGEAPAPEEPPPAPEAPAGS